MMTTQRLDVAEALLAKARSTPFPHERESFVAGARGQIDAYLRAAGRPAPAGDSDPVAGIHSGSDQGRVRGRIIRARTDARRTTTARAAYRAASAAGAPGPAVRPGAIIDLTL